MKQSLSRPVVFGVFAILVAGCSWIKPPEPPPIKNPPEIPIDLPAQSPIDISRREVSADSKEIAFHYRPSLLNLENDGHTIKHRAVASGSFINLDKMKYDLTEIQFRSPSEHMIEGNHFDIEAQFVHRNAQGKKVVVAVFLNLANDGSHVPGSPRDHYAPIWGWAAEVPKVGDTYISAIKATIDLSKFLPDDGDRNYFRYEGSLTTRPYPEGVTWVVMETPVTTGRHPNHRRRAKEFMASLGKNNRPIQKLNGRKVFTGKLRN